MLENPGGMFKLTNSLESPLRGLMPCALDLSLSQQPCSFGQALWNVGGAFRSESDRMFPDNVNGIRTPGSSSPDGPVAASL